MKIRFIEPGNLPYKKTIQNHFVYNKYLRTPSNGALTLATIVKNHVNDTYMYSESISKIIWSDIFDADIVFISIFTFNANRGYKIASHIRKHSNAIIVFGGLHATLNYEETIKYCDYVVLGEGDESIIWFIDAIKNNKPMDFKGLVYIRDNKLVHTGTPALPQNIDCIPNRNLLYHFKEMTKYNTIWPQVHASRGCPHSCDYCALVSAFGKKVRVRSVDNVLEDIRQAINFFDNDNKRLSKMLWITDDNFFANREWAISVLKAIINSDINYNFTIQARYEVGLDDEMLILLKQAGFLEIAMGIEFLEDESFKNLNKKSSYEEILKSVKNIQKHGIRVRGLFIVGADNHTKGVGERLANFVIQNNICGVLIQSMYFIKRTPVYKTHKHLLLDKNWSRCVGKVVHKPALLSPSELQNEIILASKKIYSFKRLMQTIIFKRKLERLVFMGEFFWQWSVRVDLYKDIEYLKKFD